MTHVGYRDGADLTERLKIFVMQITGTLYSNLRALAKRALMSLAILYTIAGPLLMGLSESPTLCDLRLG